MPAALDVALVEVEDAVGRTAFDRGRKYARRGRVLNIAWDADGCAVTGRVVGQGGLYTTTAFFSDFGGGSLTFDEGDCTCPVGYNCKHVAALVISVADGGSVRRGLDVVRPPAPATWEERLRGLAAGAPAARTIGTPLALELSVSAGTSGEGSRRLVARLLRPGARGGWVNGGLAWGGSELLYGTASYRGDHVALVRELHALQRVGSATTSFIHSYAYGADKTLDLTECGPHLWSLIDEAERIGLPLLGARAGATELQHYGRGDIVIDVTRAAEAHSLVRARLRIEGEPFAFLPNLFLGAGHGLVCRYADSDGLLLVRLARPAPPELRRMLLGGESVSIPTGELDRFADDVYPTIRGVAPCVSSDGSFKPPEISPPSLVLHARYEGAHSVELEWGWTYRAGTRVHRTPFTPPSSVVGLRDLLAERAVVAETRLTETGLDRYGLLDPAGHPAAAAPISLHGFDAMRVTTDVLPALGELAGLEVEIDGTPADYRDVGDAVAIGVSTAELEGERDWFGLGVTITVEGRPLPFTEVFTALASGESHMLLDDGAHFSLLDARWQSLRQLIEEARALTDAPPDSLRISRYQTTLWSELAALGVVRQQADRWAGQARRMLELEQLPEHAPPSALAAELRPYQREGFAWLASLAELELGGILADDMGLGKTLQTLALVCYLRELDSSSAPFLVVAPTSVVSNWVTEAARFAPSLTVRPVTDTLAKSRSTIRELVCADVVVTTYTLLRLDAEAYRTVDWAAMILDEAQHVKNHQAKTYRSVRELRARFKLALTGTPLENNLMELWSLLSITAPGLFPDPRRFAAEYARPIERGGDRERLARLRRRIKPLVKRRTKELVAADLPPKQEQMLVVDLHPRHRKLYETRLQRERQRVLGLLSDLDRNRFTILRSITLLRQLSLDAGLVEGAADGVPCAKLDAFVEQLQDVIGGGHRALVFSQFTRFLATISARLEQETIGYCYLDGRTRHRERVIDRFRNGRDAVFLISLKAGGFGLNLTEADYCFLLDPWWNPAAENQAIDRTHRIGQIRPVMVYRLIARDTIEEKVVALARRKAELFGSVMDDGDLFAGSLTADDIRSLLA